MNFDPDGEINHDARRAFASPFRSLSIAIDAARAWLRRYRLAPVLLTVISLAAGTGLLAHHYERAAEQRAQWDPGPVGWMLQEPIPAGQTVGPNDVVAIEVPANLAPNAIMTDSPVGLRATVDLFAGELIIETRLSTAASPTGAQTSVDQATVSIDRASDLVTVGDVVDLHDLVDGAVLARSGTVTAVSELTTGVTIDERDVAAVVAALGRGGVVVVLRGD